ncbi:MAG: FecR domain-containing protein [Planctomycetota bacterium]
MERLSPDKARLAQAPVPEARAAFRAELRSRFVSGALSADIAEARSGERPVGRPLGPVPARGMRLGLAVGALAAAALVWFVVGRLGGPWIDGDAHARTWSLERVAGAPAGLEFDAASFDAASFDAASFDGASFDGASAVSAPMNPADDRDAMQRALLGAETVSSRAAQFELLFDGRVQVVVQPGTVLAGQPFRPRAADEPLVLDLTEGEVFVRTEPGSGPHDIRIRTPHSEVLVVGTTLGVMCRAEETCICVVEGKVRVLAPGAEHQVEGGQSLFLERGHEPRAFEQHAHATDPEFQQHLSRLTRYHSRRRQR